MIVLLATYLAGSIHCVAQQPAQASEPHQDYVVRDLVPGWNRSPFAERAWSLAFPLGDLSGDGNCDWYLTGTAFDRLAGVGVQQYRFQSHPAPSGRRSLLLPYAQGHIIQSADSYLPSKALLRSPRGLRLASLTGLPDQEVGIWELESAHSVGHVPHPPSPVPGLSPIEFVDGLFRAGDLNADGYDDLFFVTSQREGFSVTGAIDGRLLRVTWIAYEAAGFEGYGPVIFAERSPPGDLDGDLVPDFVASFGRYSGANSVSSHTVARSGRTGAKLWQYEISGWGSAGMQSGGLDMTDDGVSDFVVQVGARPTVAASLVLLDGQSGGELWRHDDQRLASFLPLGATAVFAFGPVWGDPHASLRGKPTVGRYLSWFQNFGASGHGAALIDAADGTLLGYSEFPRSLRPWSVEPIQGGAIVRVLGDVDNDGFKEIGITSRAVPHLDWHSGFSWTIHYCVIGRRTLVMPERSISDERLPYSLHVPSAAGHEYYLLFSEVFEPHGGESLDSRPTNLGASPLLKHSLRSRPGVGFLDAQGRASSTLSFPSSAVPPGTKLYARAVILKPGTQDEVWTLSSVETLRYE